MSMTLSSVHSKTPIKLFLPKISPRIHRLNPSFSFSSLLTAKTNRLNKLQITNNFYGPFQRSFNELSVKSCGFIVKAQNESEVANNGEKEGMEARAESSMPERFRYLMKEAPDKPLLWPWFIVAAFMLYAWRAVLWELKSWAKSIGSISQFFVYISKLVLVIIFHFIGDPITSSIRVVETAFYTIRSFYSGVVAYAPITELTHIIMLTSVILAVAETCVPDSVNEQPYELTVAGLIGFAAVRNYITELCFWTVLVGLFSFGKLVKKRDYVSSALPAAAALAGVGEPWVRVLVITLYLTLAIVQHYLKKEDKGEGMGGIKRVPVPLVCAAMAIGVRVAAKWAGYRHLTWMIA